MASTKKSAAKAETKTSTSAKAPKTTGAKTTAAKTSKAAQPKTAARATAAKPAAAKAATAKAAKATAASAKASASKAKSGAASAKTASAKPAASKAAAAKAKAEPKPAAAKAAAAKKPARTKTAAAEAKPAARKTSAKTSGAKSAAAKPRMSIGAPLQVGRAGATVAAAAVKPAPAQRKSAPIDEQPEAAASKKPVSTRHGFKLHEYVVYPSHGVGQIVGIEEQEIAGMALELFVITFEKDKMTLRVPTSKLETVGMRKLAQGETLQKALDTLKGRARIKRTMWSRRAQEYEAKINSGDLVSIAEVVRDLYRSESQPEQSYSERQLFEAALDRMSRELAAVENLDERGSTQRILDILSKSAKSRKAAADELAAREEEEADGDAAAA